MQTLSGVIRGDHPGWHPREGRHPSEINKSDSDEQKKVTTFRGENK